MSATPESRPVKKPSPSRASTCSSRAGKTTGFDLLVVAVGLALLVAVGYVAYRTQVRGESLEAVLPFLATHKPEPAVTAPTLASTTPGKVPVNRLTDAPAPGQPAGTDYVGADSPFADPSKKQPVPAKPAELPTGAEGLFGRRYVPTEPKSKEPEVELGEETAFGRKIIKKDPKPEPKK